ncbi:hypothetical protein PR003_g10876 [Phytophthora rubi]|uniref:Uncharacterized protein n=1 Tax=Phytophthora rubi TaxID=129364 RepID=A0A6A4FPW5_9STRA|nr:hypothetical protein PR001_g25757 [Phytophthora rubi]KAE8983783.1 hypothetical protein PR002_g23148 [Phytophthora rubi]KAE9339714.1 hypothetical protein PR003_g10876 [Phytophthora rubi]
MGIKHSGAFQRPVSVCAFLLSPTDWLRMYENPKSQILD